MCAAAHIGRGSALITEGRVEAPLGGTVLDRGRYATPRQDGGPDLGAGAPSPLSDSVRLPDRAEVHGVRRARLAGLEVDRGSVRDPDADLAEAGLEHDAAVLRRVQPVAHDVDRRAGLVRAPGKRLAE